MPIHQSLISPTANAQLERALRERLDRRAAISGSMGELEPLAVRLGLVQNTLTPRFKEPTLALFAADHGLAVEGIRLLHGHTTRQQAQLALQHRLPAAVFARLHGLHFSVVDCGMAEQLSAHPQLHARKIAHGTRNARLGMAMTLEQAHAGVRVGMEIADSFEGNALACAGLGQGSEESAALVLARLGQVPVGNFIDPDPSRPADEVTRLLTMLQNTLTRHRDVSEPLEVLAALGGFELAVMVGAMLVAASKRSLIIVDGIAACAALKIAASIAPPVTDYAVFCRSHAGHGLDEAMALFRASALLELGMHSSDGCGAALAWPLIRSAAALLSELHEPAEAPHHASSGSELPVLTQTINGPLSRP